MSTLPGNPHADDASSIWREASLPNESSVHEVAIAQVEATLAVAHELRTANLIARAELALKIKRAPSYPTDETTALVEMLDTRLGLGGEGR